jgi:hypothetical protein
VKVRSLGLTDFCQKKLTKGERGLSGQGPPPPPLPVFCDSCGGVRFFMNFYNQIIDKKGLKRILSWFIENYGPIRTSQLIEEFKYLGFHSATQAGLSIGFDDLRIPPGKSLLLKAAQKQVTRCENNYLRGKITAFERYQKLIDIWTTTSENLKEEVVKNFQKTPLNPLYMMAFSGARGNISQVRQLVGMRGLMSDSGGGIIDFPIRSNFREGLSVTEYVISCYGARKGLIDTALRTADSGYLTRRLVDVAHALIISEIDCGTLDSIATPATEKHLVGRVLAQSINIQVSGGGDPANLPSSPTTSFVFQLKRNQDISPVTAREIVQALNLFSFEQGGKSAGTQKIEVRSPLTCAARNLCQLCYGWNLAQGRFVSIGESVGILAAQSIGEPGTQLTMRTFHTGGIFSTDVEDKIFAPQDGVISFQNFPRGCKVRSVHGETGFFSCEPLILRIQGTSTEDAPKSPPLCSIFQLPAQSLILVYPGKFVRKNDLCAEISRIFPPSGDSQDIDEGTKKVQPANELGDGSSSSSLARKLKSPKRGGVPGGSPLGSPQNDVSDGEGQGSPEKSFDLDNAAFQSVLSEIQGQLSLSRVDNQGVGESKTQSPKEVWVLAGKRLTKASSGKSSETERVYPNGRKNRESWAKPLPVGYLGDLFYFQGKRPRGKTFRPGMTLAQWQQQLGILNQGSRDSFGKLSQISLSGFTEKAREGLRASPLRQNAFEIRDSQGFVLPLNAQKSVRVSASDQLVPSISKLRGGTPPLVPKTYCLGDLIRRHESPHRTEYSGQIIRKRMARNSGGISSNKKNLQTTDFSASYILRRVQPHLLSGLKNDLGPQNLRPIGSIVEERDLLFQLLLPLQQSKTGDIVQGLPKIEQLFEGRGRDIANLVAATIPASDGGTLSHRFGKTVSSRLRELQQRLITEIQSVYQSQGVEIGDKHVEIIVRQMTSKVRILEQGRTSFFPDDIVDVHYVREANLPESYYEPIILGITKVAFFTESFISAASFQETKRVLMSSALQNRVDFLEGLKENVIVGRLIPAGTGY